MTSRSARRTDPTPLDVSHGRWGKAEISGASDFPDLAVDPEVAFYHSPVVTEAILFDFFGTLVEYQPDRGGLSYPATHRLAVSLGYRHDHAGFVTDWDAASSQLEADTAGSHREFSMAEAAEAFAARAALSLSDDAAVRMGASFLAEWQRHVRPVGGVDEMVRRLAQEYRLAIVSNTHDAAMAPEMLQSMGIDDHFETIVLSVDHGVRKPCESIYREALGQLAVEPQHAVFVGDSHVADYLAPSDLGVFSYLIDPLAQHPVPAAARLDTVLDLEARLRGR